MALVWCLPLITTAGCSYPSGDSIEINFYGSANVSDSTFRLDGELALEGGIPDKNSCIDVRVFLYDEDGTEICSEPLGNMSVSDGVLNVSVESELNPHYVIFHSADFWTEPSSVEYLTFDDSLDDFVHGEVTEEGEHPIDVTGADSTPCTA